MNRGPVGGPGYLWETWETIANMKNSPYIRSGRTGLIAPCTPSITEIMETLTEGDIPNYQRLETILLVEDSEDLSRSLSMRLSSEAYNVVPAFDGIDGLEKAEQFDPDLVIVDLGLPRMDGLKLLHSMRSLPGMGDVPTMVVTGSRDSCLEDRAWKYGVVRYFQKPVRQKHIVEAVGEVLRGH